MKFHNVLKWYKDEDGFTTNDELFRSNSLDECIAFRAKLPKDTKKVQYVVRSWTKGAPITQAEIDKAYRLNQLIMSRAEF
jgi:hypothetical protein